MRPFSFRELVLSTNVILLVITTKICVSAIAATEIQYTAGIGKVKRNCTYLVTVETTCTRGAQTSNQISLRFGDAKSNGVLVHHLNSKHARRVDPLEPQILDDVPRKPFQACMLDQFRVMGQCVETPICYLYLKLGGDDDWRPGFASVRVVDSQKSHLSSNNFYFRRYLPRRVWHGLDICDPEMTPFGLKYRRNIN